MLTGIIPLPLIMSIRTALNMPSQKGRAAGHDRPCHNPHMTRKGAAAGLTLGGAKGLTDQEARYQIRDDLKTRSLEKRAVKPQEVAHGFIFFPGEAKKAKELRLQLKAVDTGKIYSLTLKF